MHSDRKHILHFGMFFPAAVLFWQRLQGYSGVGSFRALIPGASPALSMAVRYLLKLLMICRTLNNSRFLTCGRMGAVFCTVAGLLHPAGCILIYANRYRTEKLFSALMISLVVFLHPASLSARGPGGNQPLREARNGVYVIAHRGAHKGIPENSAAASERAVKMGCDFVEIDVRMSKDGTLVNFHDARISPAPGKPPVEIREMTQDELKQIDIGRGFGRKWKNTRIPAVAEIFEICRGKSGIYLDLKEAPVGRVVDLVRQYRLEPDVVWYIPARRIDQIRELLELCPDCILMPDPGRDPGIDQMLKTIPARVVATDMKVLDPGFVERAHQENVLVFVDELKGTKKEWKQILSMGADGIQTDKPEKLISYLRRRVYEEK